MSRLYLCDTNCLIAAVLSWHEHHELTRAELQRRHESGEELILAAHSLAETYAVLTRLPSPHRLRPSDAKALIHANWGKTRSVHLTGREYWDVIGKVERHKLVGGLIYDALIAMSALKGGASTLLTWNRRNFATFEGQIEVTSPARSPSQ